jgi:hypothetical protein
MERGNAPHWKAFEHWRSRLFLAAAVLFAGHAAVRGIEAFTTMPTPVDAFGPTGYVVAILGLFGLYPALATRTPRIARVAAGIAAVTAPAWALISGWNFGEAGGLLPPQTDVLPGAFFFVVIVATLLLYLLFGVASLRADSHTRTVSVLLMVPVALLIFLIVGGVLLSVNSAVGGMIIGGGMAIAHGAIGGTLLTGSTRTSHTVPSSDTGVE